MEKADVDRWLVEYVEAWKSYDREQILALFSEDVTYRYRPYDSEPYQGRDAVADSWTESGRRDAPGTYDGEYRTVAIDGDLAVAIGHSTYHDGDGSVDQVYDNCYVIRFDADGRCREFTEWFMQRPLGAGA